MKILKYKTTNKNLEYCFSGKNKKDTILFVHGLGSNATQFVNQHQFFKKNYKVISLNLRGHETNNCQQNLTEDDFSLIKFAEDIILLLDKLSIKKVHYVGNSMGGNIGYELLKNYPERLLSFTTFGTTAKLHKSKTTIWFLKFFYKILPSKTIAKLSSFSGVNKKSQAEIQKLFQETKKDTILKIIPHLAEFDYLEVIQKSNITAMIIKGNQDKEINAELDSTLHYWQKKDCFQLVNMKDTGHFANLDSPDKFNKTLDSFLKNQK